MAYNQYYNEIDTAYLVNSPYWLDIMNYTETFDHSPTEEDLLDLGVYVEDSALMKNFNLSVEGNPCNVKFRMSVHYIPVDDNYRLSVRGVALDISFYDFVENCSYALGYNLDDYTREDITAKLLEDYTGNDIDVEASIIKGIINIYGQSAYDYNLMDIVYNYFEQFPNINNPCIVSQRPLPEGQSYITIYDHLTFVNNIVGYSSDEGVTSAWTPVQLKAAFDYLLENDSYFKSILSSSQIIRACFHQVAPKDVKMYINGYILDNASIVTTTETGNNQHYSGIVTHVKGGRYTFAPNFYGDNNFHNEGSWDSDTGYITADVFYNYKRDGWFSSNGLGHTALVGSGPIIDSIGNVSTLSPVNPISNLHTKWYEPDVNNVYKPLGHKPIDPTVPAIEVQTITREGTPPIVVKPRPIIGSVPKPFIDPVSPETFDDQLYLSSSGVNIYHPFVENVSEFFDWLWDRDTWHDKQEMNSNPLEAIISLHTLPLPNQVPYNEDGDANYWYANQQENYRPIVLGYLTAQNMSADPPSDLSVPIVTNRICRFCFGKVDIPRTYLDYRDFDREIYIYLPYVGFKQIRCDDITPYLNPYVQNHFVNLYLDYFIDVATGDFQAILSINKNYSDKKVLYMFNGNMAVPIPLTATDKSRLEQAKWNTLMSVGNTVLSFGGTVAAGVLGLNPALAIGSFVGGIHNAMNVANNLNTLKNQNVISVNRSGSLSCGFGALSPKTPYVVINSPIGYDTNYKPYSGDSANVTTKLGNLKGFVQCKYVHVDTLASVTNEERDEIELAILNGIII